MGIHEEDFACPRCGAGYKIVRMKDDSGRTYPPIGCRVCHGPLTATDDGTILKYFLIRRPPKVSLLASQQ